jgi:hypothetical protein
MYIQLVKYARQVCSGRIARLPARLPADDPEGGFALRGFVPGCPRDDTPLKYVGYFVKLVK